MAHGYDAFKFKTCVVNASLHVEISMPEAVHAITLQIVALWL